MFSTHLQKINTVPREYLYLGGALLVMVGLLTAVAAVASGQVNRAQLRESLQTSQQSAVVNCVETLRGTALNSCMQQAKADPYGDAPAIAGGSGPAFSRSVTGLPAAQALMPAVFSASR
jgi:hypothetical protein